MSEQSFLLGLEISSAVIALSVLLYIWLQNPFRKADHSHALDNSPILRTIFDTSLDAIVTFDERLRIIKYNPSAQRMFEQLVPRPNIMTLWDLIEKSGNLNSTAISNSSINGLQLESKAKKNNGELFPIQLIISSSFLGKEIIHTAIIRDLSETRHVQDELRKSDERYRSFIQQSSKGVWRAELEKPISVDLPAERQIREILETARLFEYNQSLARLFAYDSMDQLEQATIREVLPLDEGARNDYLNLFIQSGYHFSDMPATHLDKKQNTKHFLNSLVGTIENGQLVRIWGTHRDFTKEKKAEETLKLNQVALKESEEEKAKLLEAERAARKEAEDANRLKDEFLATVSHELRTPINGILGWVQLIRKKKLNPLESEQGLDILERHARAQAQIIEDLLDMNRFLSGKIRMDMQTIDLSQIIHYSIDTVRPAADAKDITLVTSIPPFPKLVVGDPSRLQQVLWNLLSNAVKFTPLKGYIEVSLEYLDSNVRISVNDTGEGIASEFLPHVFDRFRQADSSRARRHSGLGLGLAIARQIVELHGGNIEAKSAGMGKGATFTVLLPIATRQYEQERFLYHDNNKPTGTQAISLKGRRVLVVDDQPDSQDLVRYLLEEYGAEVETASSAREALELLKSKRPEIIISDIGMPELDGYEFMKRVRQLPSEDGGRVAAVALSAFARPEDKLMALQAGYQMHLAKPVEPNELVQVVSLVLESRSLANG